MRLTPWKNWKPVSRLLDAWMTEDKRSNEKIRSTFSP